jgi:hypothetical protein
MEAGRVSAGTQTRVEYQVEAWKVSLIHVQGHGDA